MLALPAPETVSSENVRCTEQKVKVSSPVSPAVLAQPFRPHVLLPACVLIFEIRYSFPACLPLK